jgi:hypothetical protein
MKKIVPFLLGTPVRPKMGAGTCGADGDRHCFGG